jgi:opacity protein-like surface antigen
MLAYQASVRTSWPLGRSAPYLAAGAGAVTFLSDTDADRTPQLDESQTAFALNFGGGADLGWTEHWLVRVDFRELVAFPSNDATGLAAAGDADPIWMERATLGLGYQF